MVCYKTVSGQYIGFSRVYDEQRAIHNNKLECIRETIRICKERGYLTEFLTEHEEEVTTMLMFLFDEEQERDVYYAAKYKEKLEEGIQIGEKNGEKRGIEIGEKNGEKRGIEIGEKNGEKRGTLKTLIGLVKDGLLSISDAAKRSNMTEAEFASLPDMKNISV